MALTIADYEVIEEEHQKINGELREENKELQRRIDEAIEFMENGSYKDLYNIKSIDKLLAILKGEK